MRTRLEDHSPVVKAAAHLRLYGVAAALAVLLLDAGGLGGHSAAASHSSGTHRMAGPAVCSREWLDGLNRGHLMSARRLRLEMAPADSRGAVPGIDARWQPDWPTAMQPPARGGDPAAMLAGGSDGATAAHGEVPAPGLLSIPPPNDPYFRSYQTHSLKAIGALDAWETSYGGDDVTVAVISSGVDYLHPDLAANIWRNPGEVDGNGLDDDGNGYVDDVVGWNFAESNADPADFPAGLRGTMLAGIIAAETNNGRGVAGTSWFANIMPLKVLRPYRLPDGSIAVGGHDRHLIGAVCYAANNGARVILIAPILARPEGAAATIDALQAAIDYATVERGAVVVAPAGDCGGDPWADNRLWCPDPDLYGVDGQNPEILPANMENVLGVQSVGVNSVLRSTASWGPWVDISAPGEAFMTTGIDGRYEYVSAARSAVSDFAAAHIAGIIAVMRSVAPDLSPYRTLRYLCVQATKVGTDYEPAPLGEWTSNERYGCGVVHFERTIESLPARIHGVTPAAIMVLTDGARDQLRHDFRNRYLNRGKWFLAAESQAAWLVGEVSREPLLGDPSTVKLTTDIGLLRQQRGGEIAGRTFTDTLLACPADGPSRGDLASCQRIPYTLRVVSRMWYLNLPCVERAGR